MSGSTETAKAANDLADTIKAAVSLVSKEEFLAPCKMPTQEVPLPELGEGKVMRVRGLNAHEYTAYEAGMLDKSGFNDKEKWRYSRERLVVFGAIDAAGERLFKMEDIPEISKQLHGVIVRINHAINEASGRYTVGNLRSTTTDKPPSD